MEAKHRSSRLLLTMCLLEDAQKDDPDTFCSSRMVRRGAAARGRSFMAGEDTQKSDQKPNIPFVYAADAQPLATDFRAQREQLDETSAVCFFFALAFTRQSSYHPYPSGYRRRVQKIVQQNVLDCHL